MISWMLHTRAIFCLFCVRDFLLRGDLILEWGAEKLTEMCECGGLYDLMVLQGGYDEQLLWVFLIVVPVGLFS